jgi:hypothetical protein
MCGGFVVTIGANRRGLSENLRRQIVYTLGRLFTYGFLGAMAGAAGAYIATLNLPLLSVQSALSLAAGAAMVLVGFTQLGVIRWPQKMSGGSCGGLNAALLGHFIRLPATAAVFLAGVFTGFLPCGLVYTFLALAMTTKSPIQGWLAMIVFGIGTAPALLALGCGSSLLSLAARRRVHHLAACFVLLVGGVTIYRGWPRETPCPHCDTPSTVTAESLSAASNS